MSAWDDILGVAAVGTERQEVRLPPADVALGRTLSGLDPADREGALLGAIALTALHRQAGFRPATDRQPLPEICEVDEAPRCCAEATQHLTMMLEGELKEVLPEWLAALHSAGRRVAEESLPALLEKGRTERGLRSLIVNVIGNRGRWLAAQNPEWRWASVGEEPDAWETGSRDERLFLLRTLRETDPQRARELILSTWKDEAARDRQSFLEILKTGLNDGDEPFLNEALEDRSAEVRRTAGELLLRLPSSQFRQSVSGRVSSLLNYKKSVQGKATIEVALPGKPEKWQEENKIPLGPPSTAGVPKNLGKKGWWLLSVIGMIPPDTWRRLWGKKPEEVLEAATNSEWKEALLAGIMTATWRYGGADWAEAILTDGRLRQEIIQWTSVSVAGIASHLPAARTETIIIEELAAGNKENRIDQLILQLLLNRQQNWGDTLSRAVVDFARNQIRNGAKTEMAWWQLKAALKQFALYIPPALADELSADWPSDEEGRWQSAVDEFQSVLRFRSDMLRAIGKEERKES